VFPSLCFFLCTLVHWHARAFIFFVAEKYYIFLSKHGEWIDYSLPEKKGDPGRPVIPIATRPHIFQEAICDFGASANIMPKVIYDQINGDILLYTNMHF